MSTEEYANSDADVNPFLHAITETAVDAILTIDDQGVVGTFNAAAEKMFQYRRDEVVGRSIRMLMPEAEAAMHDRYIQQYLRTGEGKIIGTVREVTGLRKQGSTFPMEIAVSHVSLEDRHVFTGIIRDITAHKQREEKLRASERRLDSILESSPMGVGILQVSVGRAVLRFVNPRFAILFGSNESDLVGTDAQLLYGDSGNLADLLRQLETQRSVRDEEVELRRVDGSRFWGLLSLIETEFEAEPAFMAWIYDITERIEARREIEKARDRATMSEAQLRGAIESISEGFALYDADDRLAICNEQYKSIYAPIAHKLVPGTPFEEILDAAVELRRSWQDEADIAAFRKARLESHRNPTDEGFLSRVPDGRWIMTRERRTEVGVVGIRSDVTQLKQAEEELQAKSKLFELIGRCAEHANKATSFEEALQDFLDDICDYNGWPVGHAYVLSDDRSDRLIPSAIWHLADPERYARFREVTERTEFQKGVGLPGRVMETGKPAWIVDVTKDANFPRAKLADEIGVRAGFAVPVVVANDVIAVLEFFAPDVAVPDETLMQTLVQIGGQLGRVAERVATAQELASREAQIREILDLAPIGCTIEREDGTVEFVNPGLGQMLGMSQEQVLKTNAKDFYFDAADRAAAVERVKADGYVRDLEVQFRKVDGSRIWILLSIRPTQFDEGFAVFGWIYDITEQKTVEEELRISKVRAEDALTDLENAQKQLVQSQKMAALGQLTAGIAHEIKNPLNFVNNFSELSVEMFDELRDAVEPARRALDDEQRDELDDLISTLSANMSRIDEQGKRADSIVRSMLQHSRDDSSEWRQTDINAFLEENLMLAYHGARARDQKFNITLEREFHPNAGSIYIAAQDISRVLLNLFNNGFYAARQRQHRDSTAGFTPVLRVSSRDCGDRVEIRVRDNGTGIPEDIVSRIFDPFFTTKPTGEGSGLGLSLSYDTVVHQHAGTLKVESEEGNFTVFTMALPRHPGSSREPVT
jgi:PAS domain S-box-containing protein